MQPGSIFIEPKCHVSLWYVSGICLCARNFSYEAMWPVWLKFGMEGPLVTKSKTCSNQPHPLSNMATVTITRKKINKWPLRFYFSTNLVQN